MEFLPINLLFFFLFIVFQFASAQIPTNNSTPCKLELVKLFSSNLSVCAPVTSLEKLPTANATEKKTTLDSFCSSPNCSDTLLNSSVTDIKSQCSTDLAAKDPLITVLKNFLYFYGPARQALCFKNSTGYCESDPNSAAVLSYLGGLTTTAPTNIDCTDCNKAILNIFLNYFKAHPESLSELSYSQADLQNFETQVTTKCGPNFLDGNIPNGSSTPASKSSNSGASIYSIPSFMSFTMLINTIFLVLFSISIAYVI